MAGEINIPLTEDSAAKLYEQGLLEREWLDRVYGEIKAEENAEQDELAQTIADTIQSDPRAADMAGRVEQKIRSVNVDGEEIPVSPNMNSVEAITAAATPTAPQQPAFVPAADPFAAVQQAQATQALNEIAMNPQLGAGSGVPAENVVAATAPAAEEMAAIGDTNGVYDSGQAAIDQIRAGIEGEAANIAGTSLKAQGMLNSAVDRLENQSKDFQTRQAQLNQLYDEELRKQQEAIDQFKGEKLDPDRWWGQRSTGEKVLAAISIALSGFAGHKNGTNKALDVITKAIDRDIDVQKAQAALKRQGLEMRDNYLTKIYSRVNSEQQAENLTRAYMLDAVKTRIEAMNVGANAEAAKFDAMQKLGALSLDSMKLAQSQGMADANLQSMLTLPNGQQQVLSDDFNYGAAMKHKTIGKNIAAGIGIAATPQAAKEVPGMISAYETVASQLKDLEDIISKYGVEAAGTKARVDAANRARDVQLSIKQAEGLGALDRGSQEYMSGYISADPLGAGSWLDRRTGGIGQRVINAAIGNESLYQVRALRKKFAEQFANNLRNKVPVVSKRIKNLYLDATAAADAEAQGKKVGQAVAP